METKESNVPATREEAPLADAGQTTAIVERPEDVHTPVPPRQDLTVALLPIALITFLVLSIIAAAWTFLAAT
jgi:hypothetical protein